MKATHDPFVRPRVRLLPLRTIPLVLSLGFGVIACTAAPADEDMDGSQGAMKDDEKSETTSFDVCKLTKANVGDVLERKPSGDTIVTFKQLIKPKSIAGFRVTVPKGGDDEKSFEETNKRLQRTIQATTVKVTIGGKTYKAEGAAQVAIAHDGSTKDMEAVITLEFAKDLGGAIQGNCTTTAVCTEEKDTKTEPLEGKLTPDDMLRACSESLTEEQRDLYKSGLQPRRTDTLTQRVLECRPFTVGGACVNGKCETTYLGPARAFTYQRSKKCTE